MKPLFLFILFTFLSSCSVGPAPDDTGDLGFPPGGYTAFPSVEERRTPPKEPDPVKQSECRKRGTQDPCGDDSDCEEICDDIFKSRSSERECLKLPEDTVEDFEALLDDVEDGHISEIEPALLDCMLDIEVDAFIDSVEKMTQRESRKLLIAIADDEDLAEVLEEEDNGFEILEAILNNATSGTHLDGYLDTIIDKEDDKSFLWLTAEGNEYSWDYFDGFVSSLCSDTNHNGLCPSGKSIEAYCRILVDESEFNDKDLKDFLGDADHFSEEYEDEVEDDLYVFGLGTSRTLNNGDFRKWCKDKIIGKIAGPCPPDGEKPDNSRLLTIITFQTGGTYAESNFCKGPGTTNVKVANGWGTSSNNQKTIFLLEKGGGNTNGFLVVDTAKIDSYDSTKTYYLYVGTKRFDLGNGTPFREDNSCSTGDRRRLVSFTGFLGSNSTIFSGSSGKEIFLASEKDNKCSVYK